MVITIDGPVASGKSTVARRLAQRLNFFYLSSGFLYRALAYLLMDRYGYGKDTIGNPREGDVYELLDPSRLVYRYDDQFRERIFYDGADITPFLKNSFVDELVSRVAANANVRLRMRLIQHSLAGAYDVVAEGRDMGTVVFPDAAFKFFLTASLEVRAQRWRKMQEKRGSSFSIEEAMALVDERDRKDCARSVAPLCVPEVAVIIDNSSMTVEEVLEKILQVMREAKK